MPLAARGALLAAFSRLDRNGDGVCTRAELIKALRTDAELRSLLQLPARVKENDRAAFEAVFQGMDVDDDRAVTAEEFVGFVLARGHKVYPPNRSQRSEQPAQSAPAPPQQHEASGSVLGLLARAQLAKNESMQNQTKTFMQQRREFDIKKTLNK